VAPDDVMPDPFTSRPAPRPTGGGGSHDATDYFGALTMDEWSTLNEYNPITRTYQRTD
jgi:hypothetical protein